MAQHRIAQFSQMDQNYTLAVSLKELTKAQWEGGRSSGRWTFDVPEALFEGQAHVRLCGLGVAVVGEPEAPDAALQNGPQNAPQRSKAAQAPAPAPAAMKPLGFWSARLSLPPTATVRHLSGRTGDLDQKALPACYLGRVMDRDSSQQPEIAGSNALRTASPIGKGWKLVLSPKSTDGTPTASLRDVQLYLHVAARGLREGG
jgi:hypothetical protein